MISRQINRRSIRIEPSGDIGCQVGVHILGQPHAGEVPEYQPGRGADLPGQGKVCGGK